MLIRRVPIQELVATVEEALRQLPLLDPSGVERAGDAAPPTGKAARRRPPPELRVATWRCWIEPFPGASIAHHRDVMIEAEVRDDAATDLLIVCRVGTMRPERPGFADALRAATRAATGEASWGMSDDDLFTRVSLPAKASSDRIVAAVREAMELSLGETAQHMRSAYGAPDE